MLNLKRQLRGFCPDLRKTLRMSYATKAPARKTRFPLCVICNEPVDIKMAKTDGDGEAVHEDCYYARSNPSRSPQYCPGTLEACSQGKRPLKLAVTEFLAEKKRTKAKKNHQALKQVLDLFVQVVARVTLRTSSAAM